MSGPAPNPLAIRRNHRPGVTRLPAGGFQGRIPKWPLRANPRLVVAVAAEEAMIEELEDKDLDAKLTKVEAARLARAKYRLRIAEETLRATGKLEVELWRSLWRTPQASEWIRYRWTREVAQFVRHQAAGELGSLEQSREARIRADSLGLTPKGMKSLMWVVDVDEVAERGAGHASGKTPSRRRLAVVDDLELRARELRRDDPDRADEP